MTVSMALDELGDSIQKATSENRTFTETVGWNSPPLTRVDLSNMIWDISNKIKKANIEHVDDSLVERLTEVERRVNQFKTQTVPYLFNGHAPHATAAFMAMTQWINSLLEPLFDWTTLQEKGALPKELTKKLRSIRDTLDELSIDKSELESQIKTINEAFETAESLPVDLRRLKEAKERVDSISSDSAIQYGRIDKFHKDIEEWAKYIAVKEMEATQLVAKCEEAYKITTTKGLAAAFELRAKSLTNTVWWWVIGLLVALGVGGWIGANRFHVLSTSLTAQDPHWGVIWMQFSLSVISFAAPLWFAWLATKQIGQRFRLAEDYAFKASVAKAYEGYRKEAARIDSELEKRLFTSALTRLEEAPLRLVENEHHSSPYQEFFNSSVFQKAMDQIPDLKNKFFEIASGIVIPKKGKDKGVVLPTNGVEKDE